MTQPRFHPSASSLLRPDCRGAEAERFRPHSQGAIQFNLRKKTSASTACCEAQIADLHVETLLVLLSLGPGEPGEIHEYPGRARLQRTVESGRVRGLMKLLRGPGIHV